MTSVRIAPAALLALALCLLNCECFSIPHLFWPKKDLAATTLTAPAVRGTILIASRESAFKQAVVERVADSLAADSFQVDIVGLDTTRDIDSATFVSYQAVVLLNTCMSWAMDRRVNALLKRLPDHSRFVILTTSAAACWMPAERRRDFDAVCAASEDAKVQPVVDEIVELVRRKTNGNALP